MPRPQPRLTSMPMLFGISLLCVLGFAGVIWLVWEFGDIPKAANADRLEEERLAERLESAVAFLDPQEPDPQLVAEILPVLQRFGKSVIQKNAAGVSATLAPDRIADEIFRQGVQRETGNRITMADYRSLRNRIEAGFGTTIAQNQNLAFDETKLRRVRLSPDGQSAVVIAGHYHTQAADATTASYHHKFRWWLCRKADGWRIYDLEELAQGTRVCALAAQTMGSVSRKEQNPAEIDRMVAAIKSYQAGTNAILEGKPNARALMDPFLKYPQFPKPFVALQHAFEGLFALQDGNPTAAIEFADRARALQPEMGLTNTIYTTAYTQLERWEDVIEVGQRHMTDFGPDDEILEQQAFAYARLGKHTESAEAYLQAFEDNPKNIEPWKHLPSYQPMERYEALVKPFEKLKDPEPYLIALFERCHASNRADLAEKFTAIVRQKSPGATVLDLIEITLLADRGEWKAAWAKAEKTIALVKKLPAKDPPEYQQSETGIVNRLVNGAQKRRQGSQAYDTAPASLRRDFFRVLLDEHELSELLQLEPSDEEREVRNAMIALVEKHRKLDPADPWGAWYTGQIWMTQKKFAEADALLAATRFDHENLNTRVNHARVQCWAEQGKALAAFQAFPGSATMAQLFWWLNEHNDSTTLFALADAVAKVNAQDLAVHELRGAAHWLKKDYAAAVSEYRKFVTAKRPEKEKDFDRWTADERIVRGLIRLGKIAEAQAARREQRTPETTTNTMDIFVAAAADDVAEVRKIFVEWSENRNRKWNIETCYTDEDLGPLLAKPTFAEIRRDFPPQPEQTP